MTEKTQTQEMQSVPAVPAETPSVYAREQPFRGQVIDRVVNALREHPRVLRGLRNASVLVTGALGFFGRYVVDVLLALHQRGVVRLERIEATDSAAPSPELTRDWAEVRDFADRTGRSLLTFTRYDVRFKRGLDVHKPTHVWHLAGIASPYWYKRKPLDTIAVAVDGLRNMMELAEAAGAGLVFTSSSEVYQSAEGHVPTPESYVGAIPSRTERSCYDVSKLLGETLTWLAYKHRGLHAVTVRIFNSFGPGMAEEDRRILCRLGSALVGKYRPKVFVPPGGASDSMPSRTYTPVANTVVGFFLAATSGASGGVYNIGLDSPELTVEALIQRVQARGFSLMPPEFVEAPDNYTTEPMRRCPDTSALRALGFEPCMSLDEGLRLFCECAQATYQGVP